MGRAEKSIVVQTQPVNMGSVDRAPVITGHVCIQLTNDIISKIFHGSHVYTLQRMSNVLVIIIIACVYLLFCILF